MDYRECANFNGHQSRRLCSFKRNPNVLPEGRSNIHQRVQGEPSDASAQQVVDPGLSHAATLRGLGLRPAIGPDDDLDLAHEIGPGLQVGGLARRVAIASQTLS